MAKLSVYYEDHSELNLLIPRRLNIHFGQEGVAWEKSIIHFSLEANFEKIVTEDYPEDTMSILLDQSNLVRHPLDRATFGIFLPSIITRVEKLKFEEIKKRGIGQIEASGGEIVFDYHKLTQLMIHVSDIEEILQCDARKYLDWHDDDAW